MNISSLIQKLEKARDEHGDLEVCFLGEVFEFVSVSHASPEYEFDGQPTPDFLIR